MKATQLTGPVAYHSEGPVWMGELHWVDMHAGDVLTLAPDGAIGRRNVGAVAAMLRPRTGGGIVVAVERGFRLEEPDGCSHYLGDLWPAEAGTRFNEGGCDPQGRLYCGSMHYQQAPGAASLYRLDPEGAVTVVLDGVTISNGLDWSPDGTSAYYADTATGRVDVFDYDAATGLTGRRPFAEIAERDGHPDGLTVDAEGGVWVALYDGAAVRRYSADGVLDAVIDVPPRKVTACTFGGERLDTLFITTSREGLAPGDEPLGGALFCATPGIAGQPVRAFAG